MKNLLLILVTLFSLNIQGQIIDYSKKVNPFIGTGGHGHTYPGSTTPFGFMQLSPDSRLDGWDGCGGYHYSDSIIYGFSHTHLSGTGVSDLADLLIMPFNGENQWNNTEYNSKFSHKNEKAHAGYYSVKLDKSNIDVELSTSDRSGMHKYNFSNKKDKKIIIDLEHRDFLSDSDLFFLNDSTLIGKRISSAWAREQHFYFVIQLSEKPIEKFSKKNDKNKITKLILAFDDSASELLIKVGISAVDIKGAQNNLAQEIAHWNFEKLKAENKTKWNQELNKVNIQTSDRDKETIFYTALYHSYLAPNIYSDLDGRFRGTDLKIHKSKIDQYTIFSLWDTFRAAHPLFTITQQKRTENFINTFLNQYQQGGILPMWELNSNYTKCMIGYHAVPVIVDAYVKGIRNFDTDLALEAMLFSSEHNQLGLEHYKKRGFISSSDESESISKTLEYAYDDWCIAVFADSLGKDSIANKYYKRALYYRNVYNPESKFMQPKFNAEFKKTFKPDEVTFDYTEANSWQYSLFAPQDITNLTKMIGGKDSLEQWLDLLFTSSSATSGRHQVDITGLIGQYAHGNEPSHHMAYLYNYTSNAHKSQKYLNEIMTTLYTNTPDGLSGNEDCGQMSAWYVMSALGFYSVTPGSNKYLLGTPAFDKMTINLENKKSFTVLAENLSKENYYVKSVFLNGTVLNRYYITHNEILNGGELKFIMTNSPQPNYGQIPEQSIEINNVTVPYAKNSDMTFSKKLKVSLLNPNPAGKILYQVNDGGIKIYKKPIKIKQTSKITSWVSLDSVESYKVISEHKKVNSNWEITLNSKPHEQYDGGNNKALIDMQYGSNDFRTGYWQGYYAQDMDVVIDLKKKKKINSVSAHFLQDANSWIWFPDTVEFYYFTGKEWIKFDEVKNTIPTTLYGGTLQYITSHKAVTSRYIKVVAKNMGECPEWHPGAGNASFIFADEIEIK
jgi:predicted alpha-1,2-mannosidase